MKENASETRFKVVTNEREESVSFNCGRCSCEIPDDAIVCPDCGQIFRSTAPAMYATSDGMKSNGSPVLAKDEHESIVNSCQSNQAPDLPIESATGNTELAKIREDVMRIGTTGEHAGRLVEYFQHPDYEVRRRACSAANKLRDEEITKHITPCLYAKEPQVRQYALKAVLSSRCCHLVVGHVQNIVITEDKEYNIALCELILKKCGATGPQTNGHQEQSEPAITQSTTRLPAPPAVKPVPQRAIGKNTPRHFAIGALFNQGHSIEQLTSDFKIATEQVLESLYQCVVNDFWLKKFDFLASSQLTKDQQEAVILSFACLGTERLGRVFEDLKGEIPYKELHLVRLSCLCRQRNARVMRKSFVCLSASRKYGGYCLAGKEWRDGKVGPWIRPVSAGDNGELHKTDIRLDTGNIPRCMDILSIGIKGGKYHPYQRENVLIAEKIPWTWQWKLPFVALTNFLDDAKCLWQAGYHSSHGKNDRIPEDALKNGTDSSLYLIRPDNFSLVVSEDYGRKKVRARFGYRTMPYVLAVTDPDVERTYLVKESGEYPLDVNNLYLTISLGEPFMGYVYKLVAAVISAEE